MARTAREIMNPELLSTHGDAWADETLDLILQYGVTAVPVLDARGVPVGVTSLRDLVRVGHLKAPVTKPASTVALNASIASVAETMAMTNRHHLVVVGADGRAVGMVSSLDVIRALLGHPVKHPVAFPHHDGALDADWSDDAELELAARADLPEAPGVLMLVRGGAGMRERSVWVEAAEDLRRRTRELAARDADESPKLAMLLRDGNLRVRWSVIHDEVARDMLAQRIGDRLASAPPPGAT